MRPVFCLRRPMASDIVRSTYRYKRPRGTRKPNPATLAMPSGE
jgi:hypothetical protein